MRVSICSVGTEIVLGDQVDSNAAWLSQRLREIGIEVETHLAVGDDLSAVAAGLQWLVGRSDAVVVGGGLGPTPDDLTREAIAAATGAELRHDDDLEEAIRARFSDRGLRMPAANLGQARVPDGATAFAPLGTAPGFRLDVAREVLGHDAAGPDSRPGRAHEPCAVYVLPGVPWELQGMYERDVLPHLLARVGRGASVTRVVHVTGMGESAAAERLGPLLRRLHGEDGLALSFLATGSEVQVRVTAYGDDPDGARDRSQPVVDEVQELLGSVVAGVDGASLEQVVGDLLRDAGQKVAFAESATAGGIAARMAAVPGASGVLAGGVAVYATEAKIKVLGIPAELIDEHTPVSEEVTCDLARRVRDLFDAAWGVGVTGVAGPGAQGGKPIGTVVWAVAGPDGEVSARTGEFPGDREAVQRRLATAALEGLRRRLLAARDDRDDRARDGT